MRASLFVIALAGCHHAPIDATPDTPPPPTDSPPDSTVDSLACTPTSATGQVIVDGPSGSASLVVTFVVHDPTGAVLRRSEPAGPDTTVMLDVPSCGMVTTSALETGGSRRNMTWTNVQPGDHLVSLDREAATVPRDVAITFGGFFQATEYDVIASCAPDHYTFTTQPDTTPVAFSPQCTANPATITVVTTAKAPTASAYAVVSMPIATTGTTNIAMPQLDPATPSTLTLYHASKFTQARYDTFTSPAGNPVPIGDAMATVSGDTATVANAPALQGRGAIEITAGDTKHRTQLFRALPTLPASIELDGDELLPLVTGTIDVATTRPTVVWGTDAPAQGDAAIIEIQQDSNSGPVEWDLALPPVAGSVQFPDLPADLWPATTAKLTSVAVYESSAITTFNAGNIRTLLFDFPTQGTDVRATTLSNASAVQRLRFARPSSD